MSVKHSHSYKSFKIKKCFAILYNLSTRKILWPTTVSHVRVNLQP